MNCVISVMYLYNSYKMNKWHVLVTKEGYRVLLAVNICCLQNNIMCTVFICSEVGHFAVFAMLSGSEMYVLLILLTHIAAL